MKKNYAVLLFVLITVLSCSIVSARDYVCYILEDAHVFQNKPSETFDLRYLEIWDAPNYKRYGFFKFDFPRIGRDEEIESITFTIQNFKNGDHENVDEHFIYYCSDSKWSEQTINWNNAPLDGIGYNPIGSNKMGKTGWIDFDITALKDSVKLGSTATIVMMQENNSAASPYTAWYSRQTNWAIPYITVKTKSGKEVSSGENIGKITGQIVEK